MPGCLAVLQCTLSNLAVACLYRASQWKLSGSPLACTFHILKVYKGNQVLHVIPMLTYHSNADMPAAGLPACLLVFVLQCTINNQILVGTLMNICRRWGVTTPTWCLYL
jgi:hypothetical protein